MANPANVCLFTGRIPTTDKLKYEFHDGGAESRLHRMAGCISVRRNFKKKDEQYYPEDLIFFTAFGTTAKYLNDYVKRGDTVQMVGSLEKSDDWVDKDGNSHSGNFYLKVESVNKVVTFSSEINSNNISNRQSEPAQASYNPLLGNKISTKNNGFSNPLKPNSVANVI